MATLHEDQQTVFNRISLVSSQNEKRFGQNCRGNQNTHFTINDAFSDNRAVYDIMWENAVQPDRLQMTVWRMRIACWIPKATNTHIQNT